MQNRKFFILILVGIILSVGSTAALVTMEIVNQTTVSASEDENSSQVPAPRGEKPTTNSGQVAGLTDPPSTQIQDIDVSAKSYLVFDETKGQTVFANEANEQLPIASLTKMLTAILAYEHLDSQSNIKITNDDTISVKPILGLRAGDTVNTGDLILAMLTGSANDAALTLGNAVEKKTDRDFEELMNEKAEKLGMNDSHFSNRLGFDSAYNYSTATDVLKLSQACLELLPCRMQERLLAVTVTTEKGRALRVRASNELIAKHENVFAVKTGFTAEAAGAMVVRWTSKTNREYIIIVLGSNNRGSDILKIGDELP